MSMIRFAIGVGIRAHIEPGAYNLGDIRTPVTSGGTDDILGGLAMEQQGREDAKQATNLTEELVVALSDVAGLAWGGTEMSMIENGDFMHFDCRLTDFRKSVYVAGAAAHKRPAR